jgi:type IV pilus assembly protein PilZ
MARKRDRRKDRQKVAVDRRRSERRRWARVVVDTPADYVCEGMALYSYITDLSALGIFLRSNNPYPAGTRLTLRFSLPGERSAFELDGVVRWVSPFYFGALEAREPGMGVEIVDASPEQRRKLELLVKKLGSAAAS